MAFDAFLGSHIVFISMEECLLYIKNICNEVGKINDKFLHNVGRITLRNKLLSFFDNEKDCNIKLLDSILVNLSKSELNRIYYKNNIYEFCKIDKIKDLIHKSVTCIEHYDNPSEDKTPEELKVLLEEFWIYLKEFVFYGYQYTDRVYKLVNKQRKAVLVIDTDSRLEHIVVTLYENLFNCWKVFNRESAAKII